jgi:hypothetical protein
VAKFDVYMQDGASSRSTLNVSISAIRLDLKPSMSVVVGRSRRTQRTKRQRIGNEDRPESRIKLRIRDTVNGYDESQS